MRTEDTARELCAIDLRQRGISEGRLPALVEQFWPVLANEIRQGIADGEWRFSPEQIEALSAEYRALLDGR
ncbi:hypothetical protein ACFSKM_06725 [Ancylobacter dichloromethanicus]|uniref:Uncharacterized protein n=1 Tax=Ancylobacter dichloromethanicus TaxID=518825 RepID=A0A9W6N195_9HYPH|nr:hypothetical protein [Ancylobacter dichloromethanicus]GLK74649.1 hypothetical protein GCM10017643_47670 [Ancylobacter dichloromethanicus]